MGQSESKITRSPLAKALIEQELQRLAQDEVALVVLDQVDSTNEEILNHLTKLNSHTAVLVIADEQIAGRGRLDRSWSSPWGAGIAMTIAIDAAKIDGAITSVPLRAGLAVQNALTTFAIDTKVKWPNDILSNSGLKIGGLLSVARDNAVLVGIGLNVSLSDSELPTENATSLSLLGHDVSREKLIAEIFAEFQKAITNKNWLVDYQQVSATLGQVVKLHQADGAVVEGTVDSFDLDGSIQLRNENGLSSYTIGDVEHLRPLIV